MNKNILDNIFNESELIFNDETLEKILNDLVSEKIFEAPDQSNQNNECAKYKDKVYNQVEIEQRISELPSYQLSRINSIESLKAAIEGLLLKETLYNIAESKGYDTTQVVEDKFEKYKMSLFLKYKKEKIVSSTELPDSIVFKYYKDNIISILNRTEIESSGNS